MSVTPTVTLRAWDRSASLSGIEINQSETPADPTYFVIPGTSGAYQTFYLPDDFQRGTTIPSLTGIQICLEVTDAATTSVDYALDFFDTTWKPILSGTENEAQADGTHIWFEIYFPESFEVTPEFLTKKFRIYIKTASKWWFSAPSPLAGQGLYDSTGTAVSVTVGEGRGATELPGGTSGLFRVLAATADAGIDFLGNKYRSAVRRQSVENVDSAATTDSYWLSKPNPSKFAVENLYFDLREADGSSTTVDRLLVDPITPGVSFHVYYSDEGDPGTDPTDWDTKLWTPILHTYTMNRREEYALPTPVNTKYVKIEFSQLQGKYYQSGTFQEPIRYQKHPKWVLDYFLAGTLVTDDVFIARNVRVVYNALELAYDYYLDDLRQSPQAPPTVAKVIDYLRTPEDLSGQLDSNTLFQIDTRLAAYRDAIGTRGKTDILGLVTGALATGNYPTESRVDTGTVTTSVSTVNRDAVLQDLLIPSMYFYLKCRHVYRILEATFEHDRAYFVGVREIAFLRDNYLVPADTPMYIEGTGDETNVLRNDFVNVDGVWKIYEDSDQ